MKKVLILGAGMVSRPMVRYLLDQGFHVVSASRTVSKAERLIDGHENGEAIELNVKDEEKLEKLISECDLAVSLLPYTYHQGSQQPVLMPSLWHLLKLRTIERLLLSYSFRNQFVS